MKVRSALVSLFVLLMLAFGSTSIAADSQQEPDCTTVEECLRIIREQEEDIALLEQQVSSLGFVPATEYETPTPITEEAALPPQPLGGEFEPYEAEIIASFEVFCTDPETQEGIRTVFRGGESNAFKDLNRPDKWSNDNADRFFEAQVNYQAALNEAGLDVAAPTFTEAIVWADTRWSGCSTGTHFETAG